MNKNLIVLFLALGSIFGTGVKAQEADEATCKEQLSIYYEYYKAKNYNDAYTAWRYCFDNCPDVHKNIYIHGPAILLNKMKVAATPEEKEELKQLLMKNYDQRLQYFPGKEGYVYGRKGFDMWKYKIGTNEETMAVLKKAIEIDGEETDASVINAYFNTAVRMYQAKTFDASQVFEVYDNSMELLEGNMKVNQSTLNNLTADSTVVLNAKQKKEVKKLEKRVAVNGKVVSNIDKTIAPLATCDRLNALYSDQFEANKTNEDWLKRSVTLLGRKKCFDGELYLKVAESYYQINPTEKAARAIALISLRNNDYSKAVTYFEEAAEKASNDIDAADNLVKAATASFKLGRKSSARTFAQKAIQKNPKEGAAFMLIGNLYASSANECGSNIFEKKAVYWAAINEFAKAKRVDPELTKEANKLIGSYSQQVPNKEMIFQFGMSGKTLKIGCWMNTSVKVPTI